MKRILFTILLISSSFVLFLTFLLVFLNVSSQSTHRIVEIRVDRGEPFLSVVQRLKDREVISNARLFALWARLWGLDKKIQWGLYRFDLPVAPRDVLNQMVIGRGTFQRVTIPEGLALEEVAELLASRHLVDKAHFLEQVRDDQLPITLGLEGRGLEGYLFPETYYFPAPVTPRDIILTMVEQFRQVFTPDMEQRAAKLGLTPHEVITLASVIEKETGFEGERPLVSAVFHNRLRLGIPLQSDPTVIYGLQDFTGNLTRKDLRTPSRYNTYLIRGLPPGPICNPGLASIRAALFPAQVSYLYFVSKNDGTHWFSETIREHNRAVKTFQKGKRAFSGR